MHAGSFGQIDFSWSFFYSFLSIILIDLVLAGDNAVVIAMAVKCLPRNKRVLGTAIGAGGAVILRVALTFACSQLLQVAYIRLVGGGVIIWIAVKLLAEGAEECKGGHRQAAGILHAFWVIVVADISMSIDNMLAVAGACNGNIFLLLFGLGLSIPFVVFTSNLLAMLMEKYSAILYIGAAVLGRVGGEMMVMDPFIQENLHPSHVEGYAVQAVCTIGVIAVARLLIRRRAFKAENGALSN